MGKNMKSIFKYELPLGDMCRVEMPKEAEILHVGVQNNRIFIWALVNTNTNIVDFEYKHFRILGTGHPIRYKELQNYKFLGTVMIYEPALVFHIFGEK